MNRYLSLLAFPLLYSFTFSPMSQSIDLSENQKGTQYLIENSTSEPMAVELSVQERSMDSKGEETLTDTKEMMILPPQMIVPPGDKRTVRVNWIGKEAPKSEKNFRVIAEQLDLDVNQKPKKKGGVKMLLKYMATLYLTPKDADAKISIPEFTSTEKDLKLVIENTGNKHKILQSPKIIFEHDGKKTEFHSSDLKGVAGENVLGNSKREFVVSTNKKVSPKSKVTIKVD